MEFGGIKVTVLLPPPPITPVGPTVPEPDGVVESVITWRSRHSGSTVPAGAVSVMARRSGRPLWHWRRRAR